MKRKALFLSAACITLVLGLVAASQRLSPRHQARTYKVVYEDGVGGGGLGAGGRGVSCYMKSWESSDGVRVDTSHVSYSSAGDARKDFEEELEGAETIIERRGYPDFLSVDEETVVATFAKPESKKRVFRVIRLKDTGIYHAEATSLEHAIAFK